MSLRGAKRRGNLPVQPRNVHRTAVDAESLYREIAPEAFPSVPRACGPRNDILVFNICVSFAILVNCPIETKATKYKTDYN